MARRPIRTWLGPSYRGEGLVGNRVVRRYLDDTGNPVVEEQPAEEVLPAGIVELRVHGVNGGTPEQNLHDPSPVRVSGDNTAGFYRRRDELSSGPDRSVEAYNWAAINSHKSIRAWWIILFPFAAANFAGWLLPKGMSDRWRRNAQIMLRLIALCVTLIAVLGVALVFVDLIGVQCGTLETCNAAFPWQWVATIASWSFIGGNAARLAVAYSLFPALAVLGLWLLGRRSRAYEAYGAGTTSTATPIGDRIDDVRMDRLEFWQAPNVVYVLGWLHSTAALALLSAVLAFTIREVAPNGQYHDPLYLLGMVSLVVVALSASGVIGISWMRQIPTRWLRKQHTQFYRPRASWVPAGTALALYAVTAWLGWMSRDRNSLDMAPLESVRNGLIVVTVVAVLLAFLLAVSIGAYRTAAFAFVAGPALFYFMAQSGDKPNFTWFTGSQWLLIEILLAGGGVLWYLRRARSTELPIDPAKHASNPVWIFGTTALVIVAGAAAFLRLDSLWVRAGTVLIPLAYLAAQQVIQVRHGHDYPQKETMREGTAAVMAALAVASALMAVSSSAVFVAGRLGDTLALPKLSAGTASDVCTAGFICYPAEVGWYSLAALAGIIVLIISIMLRVVILPAVRWRSQRESLCGEYDAATVPDQAYDLNGSCDGDNHSEEGLGFAARAVNARWHANITDDADWIISAAVMTTMTLLVAAATARIHKTLPTTAANSLFDWAAFLAGFVVVGAALLIYTARDNQQLRQTMGILWDVMSFFPRRFHPLAPPCYAERAVIDVRNRVIFATTRGTRLPNIPDSRLILAGHSEGSLITTAALLSLLPENIEPLEELTPHPGYPIPTGNELERVGFVTYGCMLARLYGRAWPDQLPEAKLVELKRYLEGGPAARESDEAGDFPGHSVGRMSRWMNFGRYSDYLGGRVFQELQRKPVPSGGTSGGSRAGRVERPPGDLRCDDLFFTDPTRRWRWHGQLEFARTWRHSFDYENDQDDPRFREHIWALARVFNGEDEIAVIEDYPWMGQCEALHSRAAGQEADPG